MDDRLVREFLDWSALGDINHASRIYGKLSPEQQAREDVSRAWLTMLLQSDTAQCLEQSANMIRSNRSSATGWIFLIRSLRLCGLHDEAHSSAIRAAKLCPDDMTLQMLAAKAQLAWGCPNNARLAFDSGVGLNPESN